jgi:hypothetical protein
LTSQEFDAAIGSGGGAVYRGVWGLPTLLSKTIIVITLDSSIVSYLGVLFHVVQSLTESQQNRSKKITKLHKTLPKRIEIISKLVGLIGGVINVSQGKIMYQAELEFHVKHRNHFLISSIQIKVVSQTGHNSQKML